MTLFHDRYAMLEWDFEGYDGLVVLPEKADPGRHLGLKTEYWDAFSEADVLPLLEKGYHICFLKNENRWGTAADLDRKARFVNLVQKQYQLAPTCIPLGMSCGGMIAIQFAARYPELVSCLYLDAPVVNFMSFPCGFGEGRGSFNADETIREALCALHLHDLGELMACREMPLDALPKLIQHAIPAVLVAGDSDLTVPFSENGRFIQRAYEKAGVPLQVFLKPGCAHHPHGLSDPAPAIEFLLRYQDRKSKK